jgi:acetyl esterase/lipase
VPFGPTVEETLDIFPAQDPDAPILVFIHGGYWRSLSSKEFSLFARGPVGLGFTVVITNYALCPKVTLPEITRQSRAAIAWVQRSSKRRCHVIETTTRRGIAVRNFKRPRRPRATWSSPRREARGAIELM